VLAGSYTVGIVVDPAFGDRLRALADQMPVWVADTPANRAAAEAYWEKDPGRPPTAGVTIFRVAPGASPEAWCAEVLEIVLEHHGPFSHDPPVTVLTIVGAQPVGELRTALTACGFGKVTAAAGGFRATAA
jgi:hypothetical protein